MAYDLEEQEQLATLKAWWERYGNAITSIVVGIAIAVAGYNAYQWYQRDRAGKAAATYDALQRAIAAKEATQTRELTGLLFDKYGSTAYAEMGALLAAKANLDAGDAKTARAQLEWAVEHSVDPEYRAIARVRLAGVLLDEGAYADAQKQVSAETASSLSVQFQAAFADRRGDIFLAENKTDDARREYDAALKLLGATSEGRGYANVVQLKLDGLLGGIASAAPVSAPAPASAAAPPPPTPNAGAKP